MNIEDIKVGETYNVRMRVTYKEKDQVRVENPMVSVYGCEYMIISHKYIHAIPSCVSMPPEKPIEIFHTTEIPETYPKYDPCRKFRKGDMVRYCAPDGRIYADRGSLREHIKNRDLTHVVRDEQENGRVGVYDPLDEENPYYVPAHSLELVTPVEELEPYCVRKYSTFYAVEKYNNHKDRPATYDIYFHQNAKAAAEAECARLNEEYRKEQK